MAKLVLTAWFVVLTLVYSVACGGDGDKKAETINPTAAQSSPGTPAAQTTVAATAAVAATGTPRPALVLDISKALLALEDFPTGWASAPSNPPSNDSMLCGKRLPRYSDKAVDYQRVEFSRGSGTTAAHIVARYEPGEAQKLIDELRQLYEGCPQWNDRDSSGNVLTYRVAAVSFPRVGDQTFAIRLSASTGGLAAQSDQVVVRRGDVLSVVTNGIVAVASATVDSDLTEKLVRRADEKLAGAPQVAAGSVATSTPAARQATPTPAPTQPLKLLSQGYGQSTGTGSRQIGYAFMVENPNPSDAAERISYQIAFYDQAGIVLKTEQNFVEILYPGETRGVAGTSFLSEGQTAARMDVQIKADRFRKSDQKQPFAVDGVTYRPDRFFPKVVGVVSNSLTRDVKNLWISAIAYDAEGKIIGGGFTFLEFVPAGGKSATEVSVTTAGTPTKVELYAAPSTLSGLN